MRFVRNMILHNAIAYRSQLSVQDSRLNLDGIYCFQIEQPGVHHKIQFRDATIENRRVFTPVIPKFRNLCSRKCQVHQQKARASDKYVRTVYQPGTTAIFRAILGMAIGRNVSDMRISWCRSSDTILLDSDMGRTIVLSVLSRKNY